MSISTPANCTSMTTLPSLRYNIRPQDTDFLPPEDDIQELLKNPPPYSQVTKRSQLSFTIARYQGGLKYHGL